MKTILVALFCWSMLLTPSVYAGPEGVGHHHSMEISQEEALARATDIVKKLSKGGKLAESWLNTTAIGVEKKTFEDGPEWVVNFNNPDMPKEKQALFVFLTLSGKALAANYTGK